MEWYWWVLVSVVAVVIIAIKVKVGGALLRNMKKKQDAKVKSLEEDE